MTNACSNCGREFKFKRSDARFCSTKCRVAAHRAKDAFPRVMRQSRRWVRRDEQKRPLRTNGRGASSTDPRSWSTFEEASISRVGVGLGWVVGVGIGCIDLDHCFEGEKLAPWAAEIVAEHRESAVLIEVSQSGQGVHIFRPMKHAYGHVIRDGRNVEIYPPDSGRYIAVTGRRLMSE